MTASVVKPDFSASWARVESGREPKERRVVIHLDNRGEWVSDKTIVRIVFPFSASYERTEARIGAVSTQVKGYGQEWTWEVGTFAMNTSTDAAMILRADDGWREDDEARLSISSAEALPVFADVALKNPASDRADVAPKGWWSAFWSAISALWKTIWMKIAG